MQHLLSRILLAGVAAGLALGAVLSTVGESLLDPNAFGRRSAESLSDPRVAAFAADRVTAAVLEQSPDLTPVRPLILATSRVIVSSEGFRAVFRSAAASAHRAVFAEGTQRVAMSVPDVGVLLRSTLQHASPELAARIPTQLEPLVGALESGPALRFLDHAWALREDLRALAQILLLASPLVLVLALWLAGDLRRGFVGAGAAFFAAAASVWALLPLGRPASTFVESSLASGAVQGLWQAFLAPLAGWALFLAGLGVLFVAAGTSLMEAFDPIERLRGVLQRLSTPPPTRRGRLLLGLALLFAGAAAVRSPTFVAQTSVVIAGLAVVFLGARALFGLVLESVETSPAAVRVGDAGRSLLRTAAIVALVVAIGGAWLALRRPGPTRAPDVIEACNGHAALCQRRVEDVSFPGTHNAMSNVGIADWMFPQQQAGIAAQLRDGVRALLIDVHYGFPGGSRIKTDLSGRRPTEQAMTEMLGEEGVAAALRIRDRLVGVDEGRRGLYLCHGFCELGASELAPTLRAIHDFLVERPGEVLMIVVEDYVSPEDLARVIEESDLAERVYRGPSGAPWPTLRDLVEAGQNAIVFLESGSEGVAWLRPAFELVQETPYTFHTPQDFSCRPNRGGTTPGLFQINHWIETTPTPLPSNAEIVNARDVLLTRARACQRERGMLPNILAVDFYRSGDLFGVVEALNGLAEADAPAGAPAGS
jgi:hypothetical protein